MAQTYQLLIGLTLQLHVMTVSHLCYENWLNTVHPPHYIQIKKSSCWVLHHTWMRETLYTYG